MIYEESSGDPCDQDIDTSPHPEVIEDQDSEASANNKVFEDPYAKSSTYTEVPKYQDSYTSAHHKVPVIGSRDDRKKHNSLEYVRTMDLYVENIDKNGKNT